MTVFVIEPIDIEKWLPAIRDQLGAPLPEQRKWADSTGSFSVTAMFVHLADGKVTLRKDDGTELAVPLAKLSKSDQEYVRTEIAKAKPKD